MNEILKLKDVSLNYHTKLNETQAVKNLSFSVNRGDFVAIIGPSGCGKTTILSLIAGLLKPSSGSVILDGEQIKETTHKIGYMLQKDHLFEWRTIEKNVLLPLEIKRIKNAENVRYAKDLIEKYGLKDFASYYPKQLSGGMRQRAALIRTLAQKPEVLLLDEPFSALDYQTRLSVSDDVYNIIKNEGKTAILVTHDISEAISVADSILVLSKRPSTVIYRCVTDIDKSLSPIKRREDKNFSKWFETLWKELDL